MIYVILSILILGAFIFPKSKIVNLLLLIIIYALFALSFDAYDYLNYLSSYNNYVSGGESGFEPLYKGIMSIAGRYGLEFEQFRFITSFIIVASINLFIFKSSNAPNIVLALYLIYSSFYDATLIRNSLAMCIAVWGIYALIKAKSTKGYLTCFTIFSVAALFHGSYWIFLFFVLVYVLLERGKIKIVSVLFVSLFIICYLFQNLLFVVFSNFVSKSTAIEEYSGASALNFFGLTIIVIKYLFIVSPIWLFPPNYSINPNGKIIGLLEPHISNINIAFLLIGILQIVAPSYSRLLRILLLINYIYIVNYSNKNIAYKNIFALLYSIGMLLIAVLWERPETLQTIIQMHFNSNILFNILSL